MGRPGLGLLITVAIACLSGPRGGSAAEERRQLADADACKDAVVRASHETGVPLRLLTALAPIESGIADRSGEVQPWPWTLNTNGHGSYHFRTRQAAAQHLATLIAAGVDNVDIGCMQVNWHWHGHAFASPDAALSPALNVRYAALLLREFHAQSGTWAGAVGLYHSRNPMLTDAYRCRVARALAPQAKIRDCHSPTVQHGQAG
jgi:hypothetical protein